MGYKFITSSDPSLAYTIVNSPNSLNRNTDYIANKYNQYMERLGTAGQHYKQELSGLYNYFNNNNFITNTIKNLTQSGVINGEDIIYSVNEDNYEKINYIMRRYVMASPTINRAANLNRINGYDNQWFDNENQGKDPYRRIDYLNVIDSTLQHRKNGDGFVSFTSTSEGNPLSMTERLIIQESWNRLEDMIINDTDPTDLIE